MGKMRDRLSHCLDISTFICLRAWSGFTAEHSPVNPKGLTLMIWSIACCVLRRSKAGRAAWRDTEKHTSPTVAPREHEGFGLKFKVKGKQHWNTWLNPCWSSVIPLQIQVLHCQHIWEGGCLTDREICPVWLSGKWGLLVQSHWLTLRVTAACFAYFC